MRISCYSLRMLIFLIYRPVISVVVGFNNERVIMKNLKVILCLGFISCMFMLNGCGGGGGSSSGGGDDATKPEITAFSLSTASGVSGVGLIDQVAQTITVAMPSGTDLGSLIAAFTTTGKTVSVNGAAQTSGVTINSFSSPVIYVVTAADGTTTRSYTVTIFSKQTSGFIIVGANGIINNLTVNGVYTNLKVPSIGSSIAVNGNGLFVQVAGKGVILTSDENGANWKTRFSNTVQDLNGVAVNSSGRFVVVGAEGTILTSDDGITWTPAVSGTLEAIIAITVNPATGRFVALLFSGDTVIFSDDGISWTFATTIGVSNIRAITVNPSTGIFVGVGNSGTIITSVDGGIWINQTPFASGGNFTGVAVNPSLGSDGRFVAVGSDGFGGGKVIFSDDSGVNWTSANSIPTVEGLSSVGVSNGGIFVASGVDSLTGRGFIITSSDNGVNWVTTFSTLNSIFDGVAINPINGRIVFAGSPGNAISDTGDIWQIQGPSSTPTKALINVARTSSGSFVAVGEGGVILRSSDGGGTWTQVALLGGVLNNVAVSPTTGKLVVVGTGGTILASTNDGITWASKTSGTLNDLNTITVNGAGLFVAGGANGTIVTSPDGDSWTAIPSITVQDIFGSTIKGSLFVMVGASGIIFTSPDGSTWTERISGTPNFLIGAISSLDLLVVSGAGGTILTSPDGIVWTPRVSGTSQDLFRLAASKDGKFVAVGGVGTILTSPDGEAWTTALAPPIMNGLELTGIVAY